MEVLEHMDGRQKTEDGGPKKIKHSFLISTPLSPVISRQSAEDGGWRMEDSLVFAGSWILDPSFEFQVEKGHLREFICDNLQEMYLISLRKKKIFLADQRRKGCKFPQINRG